MMAYDKRQFANDLHEGTLFFAKGYSMVNDMSQK